MNGAEIVATTGDAAFAVDREGKILAWNKTAEHCLGYRRSEVVGRHCWKVLRGRDMFANRYCSESCPVRDMATRGEAIHRTQMVFQAASGEEVPVSLSTLVVRRDGEPEIVHLFQCPPALAETTERLQQAATAGTEGRLSPRQREVLRQLGDGKGTDEIAELLGISPATARHHIQGILTRLKVHTRLEAVALGRRIGLL